MLKHGALAGRLVKFIPHGVKKWYTIDITMYLAFEDKGVFRPTDAGAQWHLFNKRLIGKRIYTIALIQNTLFVGTSDGLYALNSDIWEPVLVDTRNVK